MSYLLAVDTLNPDTPIVSVVIGLLVSGAVGGFAFMVKNAFAGFGQKVEELGVKVDALGTSQHAQDMARALLERDVAELKSEVKLNRDRYHELAQQTTAIKGRVELVLMRRPKTGEHRVSRDDGDEG